MARARRGRGEGSIFQRGDGRWVATISIGLDGNGKRKRRTVYGVTKGAVQAELSKLQNANRTGTLVEVKRTRVADFLKQWLDDLEGLGSVRAGTLANYRGVVNKHIVPRIGGMNLQKLSPVHLQSLYGEMARDEVGQNPRRLAHIVLAMALKRALKQGLVMRNACDAVDVPQVTKARIEPLNEKQVAALLAAARDDRLEALYHLAIGSGMRQGEMFGLYWSSLDLAAGTVSVNQSLSEVGGKLRLNDPKSKAGRRLIDLPRHAVNALEEHRKRQMTAGFGGVEFVFCNRSGGPLRRSHFHADDFRPLLKRAGLARVRFHDLRHTHATLCLLAGENPKSVQERLGHSSVVITLDTYSHVLPSVKTSAAAKLDGIIQGAMVENGYTLAVKTG